MGESDDMTPERLADDATDAIGADTHQEWERIRGIVVQAIYDDRKNRTRDGE